MKPRWPVLHTRAPAACVLRASVISMVAAECNQEARASRARRMGRNSPSSTDHATTGILIRPLKDPYRSPNCPISRWLNLSSISSLSSVCHRRYKTFRFDDVFQATSVFMNTPLQTVGDLLQLSAATPTPRLVIDPLRSSHRGREPPVKTSTPTVMRSQAHHLLTGVLTFLFSHFQSKC